MKVIESLQEGMRHRCAQARVAVAMADADAATALMTSLCEVDASLSAFAADADDRLFDLPVEAVVLDLPTFRCVSATADIVSIRDDHKPRLIVAMRLTELRQPEPLLASADGVILLDAEMAVNPASIRLALAGYSVFPTQISVYAGDEH